MMFEIVRKNVLSGTVGLRFPGGVPVEVREAIINGGFTWQNYEGMWMGLDREDKDIKAMISAGESAVKERHVMTKQEEAELKAEYMELIAANEGESWRKFYESRIGVLVRLSDGRIVNISKPSIETSFCFGESGYDADDALRMADYARRSEEHFRSENLKKYKTMIDILARNSHNYGIREDVWVGNSYRDKPGIAYVEVGDAWDRWKNEPIPTVSEEDRERLLEGYRKAYAAFEKRINAYLKRYGLSKVRSWTYWRDA